MEASDLIGSLGVALILIAFILNLNGRLDSGAAPYLLLNLTGAALAALSSAMIGFLPFVVLEGTWAAASLYGLVRRSRAPAV